MTKTCFAVMLLSLPLSLVCIVEGRTGETANSVEDNTTSIFLSDYSGSIEGSVTIYYLTDAVVSYFWESLDAQKAVREIIDTYEGNGRACYVSATASTSGDMYFWPTSIGFIQGYSSYELKRGNFVAISDNFGGKIPGGTSASGIIFLPKSIELSSRVDIYYSDSKNKKQLKLTLGTTEGKVDKLKRLQDKRESLMLELKKVEAEIATLEKK